MFLVSAGAVAQAADPFRIIPLIRDNKVLVSFDLSDGFTNEVRDAIKSGLQTTITYTVELRVEAPLWVDRTMATKKAKAEKQPGAGGIVMDQTK